MSAGRDPVKFFVFIGNHQWLLRNSFFNANCSQSTSACKKCGKENLTRNERVDIEFFGGDETSLCPQCWAKAVDKEVNNYGNIMQNASQRF